MNHTDLIGRTVEHYQITNLVGEGGMAFVFRARDLQVGRDVAIKFIRPERLDPGTAHISLKRFQREATHLARLRHPHIVPILDHGEYEGQTYLVMPYLPGGTLKQKLNGQPIPWREAIRLLLPVAHALTYAHNQGIIHRDIKPANILLTASGEPMLSDFGIAKSVQSDETTTLTAEGAAIGTAAYMSPEQAQGQEVDARADIYSLGVVLYEMITGRKPYLANTPMAILHKQLAEPLPRPSRFVPNLPHAVESILMRALARDRKARYADMASFSAALEKLVGSPIKTSEEATAETVDQEEIPPTDHKEHRRRRLRICLRRKWVLPAVAAGLLVMGMAVTFVLISSGNERRAGEEIQPPAYTLAAPAQPRVPTNSPVTSGRSMTATTSPRVMSTLTATTSPRAVSTLTATTSPRAVLATPGLHSASGCSRQTRLSPGLLAYVSFGGGHNAIRSAPDAAADNRIGRAYEGEVLQIISGPQCDQYGYMFWTVRPTIKTSWTEGWTPETAPNQDYWLKPIPFWKPCSGAPNSHLQTGMRAYVSAVPPLPNRVRASPGLSGTRIGSLEAGEHMEILDGPQCADGGVWWRVRSLSTGLTGWTIEGESNSHYIIPVVAGP